MRKNKKICESILFCFFVNLLYVNQICFLHLLEEKKNIDLRSVLT